MNIDGRRLEPTFNFTADASSVLLHQGQAEISIDENIFHGDEEVRLDLLPRAHIYIYRKYQDVSIDIAMTALTDKNAIPSVVINSHHVEGFYVNISSESATRSMTVKWCPTFGPIISIGDESTQMTWLVFNLYNFIELIGTRRSTEIIGTEWQANEHVDLVSADWKIELKSLFSTQENIKILKAEGGYRLTHIGSLEKIGGTSFSGKDASECLHALRYFLSFAKGCWCEPICPAGFNVSSNRVWESLSAPRETWHVPFSWFDPHSSSQLATLFPGFMKKCENADWREALHEVIYWYLNANDSSRGIDAGIILTQAAIERLSYEYSVKDRRLVEVEGFKKLVASDKFRLLFSSLNISLVIPSETPELQKLSCKGQLNWLDAPHALTEIRNSLVHPEHKKRKQLGDAYFEAWNLGLWYLEMGILALCGYSGTYGNRLKQRRGGQIEDVPWKQ
jgi:hypothetical protein